MSAPGPKTPPNQASEPLCAEPGCDRRGIHERRWPDGTVALYCARHAMEFDLGAQGLEQLNKTLKLVGR